MHWFHFPKVNHLNPFHWWLGRFLVRCFGRWKGAVQIHVSYRKVPVHGMVVCYRWFTYDSHTPFVHGSNIWWGPAHVAPTCGDVCLTYDLHICVTV